MITIIFLAFVGMFALAGIFISIEAKRRSARDKAVSAHTSASMERAIPANDENDLAA